MIGRKLAHYEILERIGTGGMGEVYLARDTKLDRQVAVKVLPPDMVRNPERLERFEREARTLAALNHPNIVTIHSVENAGGIPFLTMELLEGKTLSQRIERGGLSLDAFFSISIPLTDALAAAHAKGITHRDLKPGNIMVDARGCVKVLDFGLAKQVQAAGAAGTGQTALPTWSLPEPLTGEGKVVGTTAYMSPEQAEGKPVDHRSDIFSLGVVLYQIATGVFPFKGDSAASTISSILRDTPSSITELNRGLPRELGRIVMRCLAKEPERRFQTALDVRNELEELKSEIDSGVLARREAAPLAGRGWSRARLLGVAGLVVLVVAAVVVLRWTGSEGERDSSRALSVKLRRLTESPAPDAQPAVSPDGSLIAFTAQGDGNNDIFLQRADGAKAINITADSEADDSEPSFSPDGGRIAFRSEREGGGLFVMGATGEFPRRISSAGHHPSWSPDGSQLAFSLEVVEDPRLGPNNSQIWVVDLASGETRLILDENAVQPFWSPSGLRIAYMLNRGGQRDIWTVLKDGTDPRPVTQDAATDWQPVWSPDGIHLYFGSDRGGVANIWRVPVEETTGRVRGEPEAVTTGTSTIVGIALGGGGRRLAASIGSERARLEKVAFNPATEEFTGEPQLILDLPAAVPAESPDGEWLAYMSLEPQEDIYVVKSDGTGLRQLTSDRFRDRLPTWSPGGDRIAFFSNRSGKYEIWTMRPDGGDLRQETDVPDNDIIAPLWSPDGSSILCHASGDNFVFDWTEDAAAPRGFAELRRLPPYPQNELTFWAFRWSPDGSRLLGVLANESVQAVGLAAFSPSSGSYADLAMFEPASMASMMPSWLSDGRRVLYTHNGRLIVLDTETGKERLVAAAGPQKGDFTLFFPGASDHRVFRVSGSYVQDIWIMDLNEGP